MGLAVNILSYPSEIIPRQTLYSFGINSGAFYLLSYRNKKNHWEIGLHNTTMIQNARGGFSRETLLNGVRTVIDSTYHEPFL
jgi:hypothetical protein